MKKEIFRNRMPERNPFKREKPRSIDATIDMLDAIKKIRNNQLLEF